MIRYVFSATFLATALSGAAGAQGPTSAANGNVPRASYITTMDQEFGKMDADKDGKLTRAEIEAFDRAVAVANARARAEAMFTQLDTDKNGQISIAEFMKLVISTPPADGRPLIAKLDANRDGQISLIEHRAGKLAIFDQMDTDKDGIVTVTEMKAAGIMK